jgi:hypothetical protein
MTPQRIADLDALGFDWDPAETDYQRWLAALRQFVAQEGHASPVVTHVETLNGEKFTLGTWVANQRLRRRNGRMPPQEAATLETFPGWVWDPHATAFQKGLGSLAQFVEREGHARVAEGHVELFEGAEVQLGTWVSNRRQDFRAGELSAERITVLEAFPGWVWDPHATDFQEGLAVLGQFVGQEGHARVAQSHVESFEGAEFSLGSWVSNRRRDFKAGKLSAERIDALEAFPGWEWNPGEKRR